MDYSQYFVVPVAARAAVAKVFEEHRVIDDGKFLIVVSDDQKAANKLDVVLDFHNDEWSAWGFTVYAKGKQLAHGLFGENGESGVSLEDNCLEGDIASAATLLGVNVAKLCKVIEADEPDVEKFMKTIGFGRYSITPYEFDREHRSQKQELFNPDPPPKQAKKPPKKVVKKPAAKTKPAKTKPAKTKPTKTKPTKTKPTKTKPKR